MDLKSTYNKIAEDWDNDHCHDTWWFEGTDKFISFFKPGASILDIGCGAGTKSDYLIRHGLKVTGIDFSEKMIKLAVEKVPAGTFWVKDFRNPLGFDHQFEGVFAQAALLHIPKKEIPEVLANIIKLLKPNGYLYVAVKELKVGKKEEEIIKENDYGYEYERFFSLFTLDELEKYIVGMRMKIVYKNVTTFGKTNWIQIIAMLH